MDEHAPLAPSGSVFWGPCPGHIKALKSCPPRREHPRTAQGTAAHWVFSETLTDGGEYLTSRFLGQTAPNGLKVDEEMVEGAQVMVSDILKECQKYGALRRLLIEHRVEMPQVHKLNWGTLDAALYLEIDKHVIIWDYKHGHSDVNPKEHLQLIDYFFGIVNKYDIRDPSTTVSFRIVQPFSYNRKGAVKKWESTLGELEPFLKMLRNSAALAFTENPSLYSGLHCKNCPALLKCDVAAKQVTSLLTKSYGGFELRDMNAQELGVEKRILESMLGVAKKRLEALDDEIEHRVRKGETGSGFTLQTTTGAPQWNKDVNPDVIRIITQQLGVDSNKPGLITPTQTIKKAKGENKDRIKELLKPITHRPKGTALVESSESITSQAFTNKEG
jgi:hypothetical protein